MSTWWNSTLPITRARSGAVAALVGALAVTGLSLAAPPPATAANDGVSIDAVIYRDSGVTVTGTAPGGASVDVTARSAAQQPADESAGTSVVATADGSFSAQLPATDDAGQDLRYAAYTASADGVDSAEHFVDDVTARARSTEAYPTAASKKGLQVQLTDDAEELGISHAAVNVSLGAIMLNGNDPDRATIDFRSGGETYYFDESQVNALDTKIRPLSDAGILVNLIVLVYRSSDPYSAASVLAHPDADATAGTVLGFNTATDEGVRYLTAAMEFLADRYTRTDQRFGRAVGYIMGNEVDAQWEWSNSGELTLEEFLDGYARALRIAYLATTKYYAAARSYVSLTHSWTTPSGSNPDADEPTRFYAARDLMDGLDALTAATGDFGWNVAYHPYPEDLADPTVWDDPDATESEDAPVVTFRNLDVLPDYLADNDTYDGAARRVILSEQGCNTTADTQAAERTQAACVAYAYYRTRFLDGIDAMILHRHVDHGAEGGLNLGLWARDVDSASQAAPLRRKLSWSVYRDIDTAGSRKATGFALDVIGADSWGELIPGFDASQLDDRSEPRTLASRSRVRARSVRTLGLGGWTTGHNLTTVQRTSTGLVATGQPSAFGSQWRGVRRDFAAPVTVGGRRWLVVGMRLPEFGAGGALAGVGAEGKVRVTSAGGRVSEARVRLERDGRSHRVAVDLSGVRKLRTLEVMVRGTGTRQDTATFRVESIGLTSNTSVSHTPNIGATAELSPAATDPRTVTVEVTNLDRDRQRGRLVVRACQGGLSFAEQQSTLDGLASGRTRTIVVPVDAVANDVDSLCLRVRGTTIEVPVAALPEPGEEAEPEEPEEPEPTTTLIDGFEDGDIAGWTPGTNVDSMGAVTQFANGPTTPHSGSYALEAISAGVDASLGRVMTYTPDSVLDLGDASSVSIQLDSYGGAPSATGYEATIELTSQDGDQISATRSVSSDSWNELSVDVSAWDGRATVASVSVSFRAVGTTTAWLNRMQLDDLSWTG